MEKALEAKINELNESEKKLVRINLFVKYYPLINFRMMNAFKCWKQKGASRRDESNWNVKRRF
jgi:hypothetical protein